MPLLNPGLKHISGKGVKFYTLNNDIRDSGDEPLTRRSITKEPTGHRLFIEKLSYSKIFINEYSFDTPFVKKYYIVIQ